MLAYLRKLLYLCTIYANFEFQIKNFELNKE